MTEIAEKAIDQSGKLSIQATGRGEVDSTGTGLLSFLAAAGEGIAPWWSTVRDNDLRRFFPTCGYFNSAVYTIAEKLAGVPFRIEPRDPDITGHWRQAQDYESMLLEMTEFTQGWDEFVKKLLVDFWTQDNGLFAEIIGAGRPDGPIRGPVVGLAHLDAWRCCRTGNPEYPVIYQDVDGARYRLHHTRVMYRAQLPSAIADMHGVGLCWLSRCITVAQGLSDVIRYKLEKLGSRPLRAILVGQGIAPDQVVAAVQVAEETANARGFTRLARYPVLGNPTRTDINLSIVDLASLPDGFDFQTDLTLGIYAIAMAGGFPARWIWPATATGATKADALYQHLAGQTAGIGGTLRLLATLIGGNDRGARSLGAKVLPPHLKMVFDFQDDEQDRARAEIARTRSETRASDLAQAILNVRTVRENMQADGEISEAQFAALELADGRLPDGVPVTLAIQSANPFLAGLAADPDNLALRVERQQAAEVALVNSGQARQRRQAEIALACLAALAAPGEEAEQIAAGPEKPAFLKAAAERLQPVGQPLEPWPEGEAVPITAEDIARAVKQWDDQMPAAARGILQAEVAPDA